MKSQYISVSMALLRLALARPSFLTVPGTLPPPRMSIPSSASQLNAGKIISASKVILNSLGDPSVLKLETVEFPPPGPNQVRVKHKAIGLNLIETYFRKGIYPMKLPAGLGQEAAGVVESIGANVHNVAVGDRVSYAAGGQGSYADFGIVNADNLVKIPDSISFEQAAAVTLKGLTAQFLVKQIKPLKAGDTVVVWAAVGGVGLFLLQWFKAIGVKAIAITSSAEKVDLANQYGAWKTINYKAEDVVAKVLEFTDNKKVSTVYDSVGASTFIQSLDMLAPHGLLVSYGNASGPVKNVDLGILNTKGSLFVTRPSLFGYATTPEKLSEMSQDLFATIKSGDLKININQRYDLKDIAKAHEDIESGKTTGSTIIFPSDSSKH